MRVALIAFGLGLLLAGCTSEDKALTIARGELDRYCAREHVSCTGATLVTERSSGTGWYLEFEISRKPSHRLEIYVSAFGSADVSIYREPSG